MDFKYRICCWHSNLLYQWWIHWKFFKCWPLDSWFLWRSLHWETVMHSPFLTTMSRYFWIFNTCLVIIVQSIYRIDEVTHKVTKCCQMDIWLLWRNIYWETAMSSPISMTISILSLNFDYLFCRWHPKHFISAMKSPRELLVSSSKVKISVV